MGIPIWSSLLLRENCKNVWIVSAWSFWKFFMIKVWLIVYCKNFLMIYIEPCFWPPGIIWSGLIRSNLLSQIFTNTAQRTTLGIYQLYQNGVAIFLFFLKNSLMTFKSLSSNVDLVIFKISAQYLTEYIGQWNCIVGNFFYSVLWRVGFTSHINSLNI